MLYARLLAKTLRLTATLTIAVSAQSAQAKCRRDAFRFFTSTESVSTNWRVEKNSECSTHLTSTGKMVVENIVLAERPAHGIAGVNNTLGDHGFAYKSAPNFTGTDHFKITLDKYESDNVDFKSKLTIDVDVDVVDKL
jgi:hypothetical protein